MKIKSLIVFICLFFLFSVLLFPQVKRLKVIAERADIYLEPDVKSLIIETVGKGTILTLQSRGRIKEIWYYVYFHPAKKDVIKSGYILVPLVELTYEIQKEIEVPKEERLKLVLQRLEKLEREIKKPQKVKMEPTEKAKSIEKIKIKPIEIKQKRDEKKLSRITLGLGAGQSHGGIGMFLQYKTQFGLAFHGGIGYFPASNLIKEHDWVNDVALFSGGLKYYFPVKSNRFSPYIDIQFGGLGVESYFGIYFDGLFDISIEKIQKTFWGPSFLGGLEIKLGKIGLNGALGLSYNTTDIEWTDQNFFFALDIGLLIYF